MIKTCPRCLTKEPVEFDFAEEIYNGDQWIDTIYYYNCRFCEKSFNSKPVYQYVNRSQTCEEYIEFRKLIELKSNGFQGAIWSEIKKKINFKDIDYRHMHDSIYWGDRLKKLKEI